MRGVNLYRGKIKASCPPRRAGKIAAQAYEIGIVHRNGSIIVRPERNVARAQGLPPQVVVRRDLTAAFPRNPT